jgi:galactokinase
MSLQEQLIERHRQRFNADPAFIARAPGRVNLLGEHVDYNDGFVLPAAINRATWVAFSPAEGNQSTLVAADLSEEVSFSPENLPTKTRSDGTELPEWAKYVAGVMWALSSAGHATPTLNAVFGSNVPRGAGLSSSAALELAFAVAWQKLGNWTLPPMDLALLCQRAENIFAGVNCGIMDQFSSACGEPDRLLFLDCRSLTWQTAPLPANVVIVIADTSVRRSLASGGAYNERRASCEEAVRLLSEKLPGIHSLRDVTLEDFNRLSSNLPELVAKRAAHVVNEIQRSQNVLKLLESGDMAQFGKLMNECHASLRDLFEVSCPELDVMVAIGQALPGCYGARLTGAGFGGCSVNLVAAEAAQAFSDALATGYEQQTGRHPEIYICRASGGASVLQ